MKKVSIIGAGNVGATAALHIAELDIDEVVLVDIVDGVPQGKALDMAQSASIHGFDTKVHGSNEYEPIKESDIVVITAGLPRKPGMSRDDLLIKNFNIMKSISENIKKYAPKAIVIVVTNPLDAMVYSVLKLTGFNPKKVIGMAGVLDTARFKAFLAMELKVSVKDIQTLVLGGHGDTMVPLPNFTTISGIPVTQFLDVKRLDELIERTKNGGAEIVNLLKTGSAFYAPGAAVAQMVESIIFNKRMVLPCSAYLNGEYGLKDVFFGVPVVLGQGGVEQIIKLELDDEAKAQIKVSGEAVINNRNRVLELVKG